MDILTNLLGKAVFPILKFLFRKPLEGLNRWLFEEAYRISSLHRTHRQLRYQWDDKLSEHLSYHINWHKLFLGKEQKQCTLWIKASRPGEFKKLIVRVDARLDNLRYQSVKTIYDVTEVPTIVALPDIPLRELEMQNGLLYQPYSSVSIELIEILDGKGKQMSLHHRVRDSTHPVDNLEAALGWQEGDVYRWGKWWNLDFLECAKTEFYVNLHARAFNARLMGSPNCRFWAVNAWLGEKRWFQSLIFWYNNLVTARGLKRELAEYLERYPLRKEAQQTADESA